MTDRKGPIYIAGPMRGIPKYNFPAFDEAQRRLEEEGWEVISPAEMDREVGFDEVTCAQISKKFLEDAMERDVRAIIERARAIALLPGWARSTGAQAEMWLGRWKHIPIYLYPAMLELPEPVGPAVREDILHEAYRLTTGDRNNTYGPPTQDFSRTAAMWGAIKGVPFSPREVAMFMIALKLSRETHQCKRDSWVDIAGYARCGWLCAEAAAKNELKKDGGQ